MDHVQQILLKQLSGQPTNAAPADSGQVDWAAKAKQWAEEQKRTEERRKREALIKEQHQTAQSGSLQGWKNEHPSWHQNDPIPPPPPPPIQHQQQTYQVKQNQGFNNESFNARFAQYQQQKRQQHQQQRLPQHRQHQHHHHQQQQRRKSFQEKKLDEKNEISAAKQNRNLPKWMLDEIERIQTKQSAGEDLEEGDEKHLSGWLFLKSF